MSNIGMIIHHICVYNVLPADSDSTDSLQRNTAQHISITLLIHILGKAKEGNVLNKKSTTSVIVVFQEYSSFMGQKFKLELEKSLLKELIGLYVSAYIIYTVISYFTIMLMISYFTHLSTHISVQPEKSTNRQYSLFQQS